MKIHAEIKTPDFRFIVIETGTGGGGKWAFPVRLSTVKLPVGAEYKHARQADVTIIETWTVDRRNQGPKSGFGQTLKALIEELPGHVYPKSAKAG